MVGSINQNLTLSNQYPIEFRASVKPDTFSEQVNMETNTRINHFALKRILSYFIKSLS